MRSTPASGRRSSAIRRLRWPGRECPAPFGTDISRPDHHVRVLHHGGLRSSRRHRNRRHQRAGRCLSRLHLRNHVTTTKWPVAIIGSGNIGTDLMIKILRGDGPLTIAGWSASIPDPTAWPQYGWRAHHRRRDRRTAQCPDSRTSGSSFDATAAGAHKANNKPAETGVRVLDLTPAAIGPYCVPVVNPDHHLDAPNLNMVTRRAGDRPHRRRGGRSGSSRTRRSCLRSRRSPQVPEHVPASTNSPETTAAAL